MSIAQTIFRKYLSMQQASVRQLPLGKQSRALVTTEEKAPVNRVAHQGARMLFRARDSAIEPEVIRRMERRDRVIFLLLDGKRTISDVARLVHRSELDVAYTIACLLRTGYVERLGEPTGLW
ncbi:MAG: hypothetical protein ABI456_19260 [Ktedonobacteraceae bacterium]|nr:hypothetical protein [Chloroflexota bacterium]